MIKITDKSKCSGCHACASICAKKAITMTADSDGFLYPQVDMEKCVDCGLCEKVCPICNPMPENKSLYSDAYAAYMNDDSVRLTSSSGGVFTAVAEHILSNDGVVFGAALSDNCRSVKHIAVTDVSGLSKLRGSKYTQSTVSDAYISAKKYLDDGRTVLFTGTPCQTTGLLAYLRLAYDNLYTQDIVCHGVPSPLVWNRYVGFREEVAGSKACDTSFRDKTHGWKYYSMSMRFSDGSSYCETLRKDTYLKGFLADIYIRNSCYSCHFRGSGRHSDITLADYWGISASAPDMDDDKGTSLVMINSAKGRKLFDSVSDRLVVRKSDIATAAKGNPAIFKSPTIQKNRSKFYSQFGKTEMLRLITDCSKKPFGKRMKGSVMIALMKIKKAIIH